MASTAVSIEAYAVMTTIFIQGLPESSRGIKSRPLAVPRRRSTNAKWNVRRETSATASWKLLTAVTRCPSASRQMDRVFRMFPSSSTTRILRGETADAWVVMGSLPDGRESIIPHRPEARDTEIMPKGGLEPPRVSPPPLSDVYQDVSCAPRLQHNLQRNPRQKRKKAPDSRPKPLNYLVELIGIEPTAS